MTKSGFPKVSISLSALGRGQVSIDGVQIPGIDRVSFEAEGHRMTRVVFSLPADVEMTAEQAMIVFDCRHKPQSNLPS